MRAKIEKLLTVTVSAGATAAIGDGETSDAILLRADAAMYAAKQAGRNCTFLHDGQKVQPNGDRAQRIAEAHDAIVSADGLATITSAEDLRKAVALKAAVTGTTRWITVACKFSDIATEQKPVSFFQGQYGTAPGQLGHYWPEVSYGKINLTGSDAYGWFVLPQPRSFYVTTDASGNKDANLDQLFKDCAAVADATVTFTGAQGINMMFNGDLDGYAWGGSACGILDGSNKCI